MTLNDIAQMKKPHLLVMFKMEDGNEMFQWGVAGEPPLGSLVGYITKVQHDLVISPRIYSWNHCEDPVLVIVWDVESKEFTWYFNPDVPVYPIAGMLEFIKATLVATQMARLAAAQQVRPAILDPNGKPFRQPRF